MPFEGKVQKDKNNNLSNTFYVMRCWRCLSSVFVGVVIWGHYSDIYLYIFDEPLVNTRIVTMIFTEIPLEKGDPASHWENSPAPSLIITHKEVHSSTNITQPHSAQCVTREVITIIS